MNEPELLKIDHVAVAEVDARDRLRPVSEAGVESLIASIRELGVMKDAIHVRRRKNGQLTLIAGGHRLEAARRLGWEKIPAKIWAGVTDDWARMMELDDNLAGAEMDPLDTAVFLAHRKRLYEKLHPETVAKTGAALAAARWNAADIGSVASFATATAQKFGMTERHIRRMIAAGGMLHAGEIARLRAAPRKITLADLQALSKVSAPERYHVVAALAEGRVKSAAEGRRDWASSQPGAPTAAVKDPVKEALKALSRAWDQAPEAARMMFIASHEPALSSRLQRHRDGVIINRKLGLDDDADAAEKVIATRFGPTSNEAAE